MIGLTLILHGFSRGPSTGNKKWFKVTYSVLKTGIKIGSAALINLKSSNEGEFT